jgi:outer membrane protein OmpA-like peptidoglycan-associated protein
LFSLEYFPAVQEAAPPPADRDLDGIIDREDACPDQPGPRDPDPKKNGCPPPSDRDKDGILDVDDACPEVAGVKTDDPKTNGCPPPPADRDKDGIIDTQDACPDVPGVPTNDPKTHGCPPPPPDRDKDTIIDPEDACPDQPGPRDPDPKKNGCPAARIDEGQIKIIQQVKFDTAKATIRPESDAILQAVAAILKEHPEIKLISVEGHTDNKGVPGMNKTLSTQRAAAVVTWLSKNGIDKKRMTSAGFGQERPIDSNDNEAGRQNNRRVEFHIRDPKQPGDTTTVKEPAKTPGKTDAKQPPPPPAKAPKTDKAPAPPPPPAKKAPPAPAKKK